MALVPDLADTIVAIATPPGVGALGIIRVSGPNALAVVQPFVKPVLADLPSHTVHLVTFWNRTPLLAKQATEEVNGEHSEPTPLLCKEGMGEVNGERSEPTPPPARGGVQAAALDQAVLTLYRAPRSYTREDVVELTLHGSPYILARAVELLTQAGARVAAPGEFTLRAFLAGALDLSQAEAVADLIASRSARSQQLAFKQLRGGVSTRLAQLRDHLLGFAALIELELDFSEEDVAFADRTALDASLQQALAELQVLIHSFQAGNAIKEGIPTVIAGRPNAGKSTLLNRLLDENRAIVSDIPGTTRDVIEERFTLGGVEFRLMDTAGIRDATDTIEAQGVERTLQRLQQALVVILLYDPADLPPDQADAYAQSLPLAEGAHLLIVANKSDVAPVPVPHNHLQISALRGDGLTALTTRLTAIGTSLGEQDLLVTNQRHLQLLRTAHARLAEVRHALHEQVSGELLALDIRHALTALGEITGEVTSDEILGNIFSRFCIGK